MTVRKALLIGLALCLLLPLVSCGAPAASQPTSSPTAYASFSDDTGNTVTLAAKPEKVAVLFSSYADIWQDAGGTVSITVGESVQRGLVNASDVTLVDSGAGKTIDTEALIAARPDLVIATADLDGQVKAAGVLRDAGIACALFRVDSFDDYLHMLKICTGLTGDAQAYTTYGTDVQARIGDVLDKASRLAKSGAPKTVLFIRCGSAANYTKAKTADNNFVCAMLKDLGVSNIAEQAPVLLDGLSLEEILAADPDYIFLSTMGDEQAAKTYMNGVLAGSGWQRLTAVRTGNYDYLPKDLFQFKPNARWDQAYAYLLKLLYPGEA